MTDQATVRMFALPLIAILGAGAWIVAFPNALGLSRPLPEANQTIYRAGAPHTDVAGNTLLGYRTGQSFLPIGLYHALQGRHYGRSYDFAVAASAGFNVVHPWEGQKLVDVLEDARRLDLKIVHHEPRDSEVAEHARDPAILAWYLDEEPTTRRTPEESLAALARFKARGAAFKALGATQPVIAIDGPPRRDRIALWREWASAGDAAVHFNYPVTAGELRSFDRPRSIARSVSLAADAGGGRNPTWFLVQAFAAPELGWRMPSPRELRTMVYAAIVHGATGIFYFALDSFATRDGGVLGIAPDPVADYGPTPDFNGDGKPNLVAGADDLEASRALWAEVVRVNHELAGLAPWILSPTSRRNLDVRVTGRSISETPIRTLLKERAGELALFAVNLDDVPLLAEFTLEGQVLEMAPLIAGTAAPSAKDGRWQETVEGWGVRLYRILPASGGGGVSAS